VPQSALPSTPCFAFPLTDQNRPFSLLHSRQFVLSPTPVDPSPGWNRTAIGSAFHLATHPTLQVVQSRRDDFELTLLGFILDPENPHNTDAEILRRLCDDSATGTDVVRGTSRMGGRWILIVDNGDETVLFTDPCGLRQVCHTKDENGSAWCASQSGLLAQLLDLEISDEANEFMGSLYFTAYPEYWWPGTSTPFAEVEHLLPNHLLELRTGSVKRFWPWKPVVAVGLDEGVKRGGELLKGILKSASQRFPLALAVTAGLDSRSLLAAARDLQDDIFFYTLKKPRSPDAVTDIAVAKRLLGKLALHHSVIDCGVSVDPGFDELYKQNVATAHPAWGSIVQALSRDYPRDRLVINGNCAEIARCYYRNTPRKRDRLAGGVTPELLAYLENMEGNAFALRQFQAWLDDVPPAEARGELDVLDLFYWEQRMGKWQAMSQLEWDLAQETLSPYNVRDLLTLLLGVDAARRNRPERELFLRMIRELWPEVLSEPFNPKSRSRRLVASAKRATISLLGDTAFFQESLNIYRRARSWVRR
jgi:hypothetical protein